MFIVPRRGGGVVAAFVLLYVMLHAPDLNVAPPCERCAARRWPGRAARAIIAPTARLRPALGRG